MINFLKTIFLLLMFSMAAFAQTGASIDSALSEIESLYNNARYVDAELEARRLMEEISLTDSAKVQIEKWIAFSLIAQGKIPSARERFVVLLSIYPDFELDPVLTSPKILSVFNDARAKYLSQRRSQADTSHTVLIHKEQKISFRAIVFPGWEQLYQNNLTSGYIFLGAGIATFSAGVGFEFLRADARDTYLKATVSSDISAKYNTYNSYRKAEIYSFIAFAVVYIASEIHVFTDTDPLVITFQPSPNYMQGNLLTVSFPL